MTVPGKKEKLPLSVTHPELAKEADGWDPSMVTFGSGKKLSWRCKEKHSWDAVVVSRASLGTGCPFCAGSRPIVGKTDLKSTHPQIATEAFGWDPTTVSANSNRKMRWQCKFAHIWETAVSHRTRGTGCPFCSGQKVLPGFNDLKTKNLEIAAQAFGWDPNFVLPQSNKKYEWICSEGHIWRATSADRIRGTGCPVCSNQKLLPGYNDMASQNPDLAKEADGWDPSTVFAGTNAKLDWKCKLGHKWKAVAYARNRGNGCPTCAGKKILIGFNDLASLNPDLAKEADGWDASKFTISNGSQMPWKCKLGHRWTTTISHRSTGTNCPTCTGQKVLAGFNDLESVNPDLAKEAFEWDPATTTASGKRIEKWKCPLGHIYMAAVKDRTKGNNCSVCAGKQIIVGINDLTTLEPVIATEAYEWDPTTVTPGSAKKQNWKCKKGHIYEATTAARTRKDGKSSGCGICAGKIVLVGYNDLLFTHPEIAKQANGWDPKTITLGSSKIKAWKCSEGHKWNARVNSRRISGCPTCAPGGGFDPNSQSYFYFLSHIDWNMFQIGITNYPEQRLHSHELLGWSILEIRGPMDGHLTQQWETSILRMLKAKGADLSNAKIAGKFDGYTEAWSKSTFEVKSIKELMMMTEDYESNI